MALPGERHYDSSDEALAERYAEQAERQRKLAKKMSKAANYGSSPYEHHMEAMRKKAGGVDDDTLHPAIKFPRIDI